MLSSWIKNPVRTSQETHYVSATELSQLMLCKIWGFYGGDYEEWRLLGYKTQLSQKTHCVSATKTSQLMLCKTWGFHGSNYDECRLLGYKNSVRTSLETHYVSATEPCGLMLCKTWGFYGGDYEECRLLGYKNRVRTSQETHYVSATEPGGLVLCKIWGFHGGDYEEYPSSYLTSDTLRFRYRDQPVKNRCENLTFYRDLPISLVLSCCKLSNRQHTAAGAQPRWSVSGLSTR
jgi:hypothetical protein